MKLRAYPRGVATFISFAGALFLDIELRRLRSGGCGRCTGSSG